MVFPPPPPLQHIGYPQFGVVKAEMLERALSLWMYVTAACQITLSGPGVLKQGLSGLQSAAGSSDQAQRPICRLKRLWRLLYNRFFPYVMWKNFRKRCAQFWEIKGREANETKQAKW